MTAWNDEKRKKQTKRIAPGDQVILTHRDTVKHYQAGGLSITGIFREYDPDHFIGRHWRPYLIEFPDFPGRTWGFSADEFRKL